jgi:hypothetical protein
MELLVAGARAAPSPYMPDVIQFTSSAEKSRQDRMTILVLKLDHRGDLVTCLPALAMLKQWVPDSHVVLVVSSWNEEHARKLDMIDQVLVYDFFSEDGKSKTAAANFLSILPPGQSYDMAIDLRLDNDTRFLLEAVPAEIKCGFSDGYDNPFLDLKLNVPELSPGSKQLVLQHINFCVTTDGLDNFYKLQVPLEKASRLTFGFTSIWVKDAPYHPESPPGLVFIMASIKLVPLRLRIEASAFAGRVEIGTASMDIVQRLPFRQRFHTLPVAIGSNLSTEAVRFKVTINCLSGTGYLKMHDLPWHDPSGSAIVSYEKSLLHRSEQYSALVGASVQRLTRGKLVSKLVSQ